MNAHEVFLLATLIAEGIGILVLLLFSCLKLRGNLRLFVIGMFIFLIVDAVDYGVQWIAQSTAAFDANAFFARMIVYAVQGIVLAFCAYSGVKLFINSYAYRFRDFFTIGAGAGALNLFLKGIRFHISTFIGLRTPPADSADPAVQQLLQSIEEYLQIPIPQLVIGMFEVVYVTIIILFCAYIASSALEREEGSNLYIAIGAGAYFVFFTAISALNKYVSAWVALAFGIAAAVGAVLVMRSERE